MWELHRCINKNTSCRGQGPPPPVHAPYSKMGRPVVQTTPQVEGKKIRVDTTNICRFPLRLSYCLLQESIQWVSELLPVYVHYSCN